MNSLLHKMSPKNKPFLPIRTPQELLDFRQDNREQVTNEEIREKLKGISVSVAIQDWIGRISPTATAQKYLSSLRQLFLYVENGALLEQSVLCLENDAYGPMLFHAIQHRKHSDAYKRSVEVVMKQFLTFVHDVSRGILDVELADHIKNGMNRAKELSQHIDWDELIDSLPTNYKLLAKILRVSSKKSYYKLKPNKIKSRSLLKKEGSILGVKLNQVNFNSNSIYFFSNQSFNAFDYRVFLNKEFIKELYLYSKEHSEFLFLNSLKRKIQYNTLSNAINKSLYKNTEKRKIRINPSSISFSFL